MGGLAVKRGMTIIEVLISMLLLGFVTTLLYSMLLAGQATWRNAAVHAGGRQSLQAALWRIAQELREARRALVTDNTAGVPCSFGFFSARDSGGHFVTNSSGVPEWKKYVIYYIPEGSTRLLRKELSGIAAPQSGVQLAGYCDGKGRLISAHVAEMRLLLSPTSPSAVVLLHLRDHGSRGEVDMQSGQIHIFMRN